MAAVANTFHRSDNAEKYRQHSNFVFSDENTREVLKLLDPQPGDVILDVGCGTGELTAKIHAIAASGVNAKTKERGYVFGVDRAQDMINAAKRKSPSGGPRYDICDGHDLLAWLQSQELLGRFDKVFRFKKEVIVLGCAGLISNLQLHWMKESPFAIVKGMKAALKPSGLLAIEMGGHLNGIGVRSALIAALKRRDVDVNKVDPWYFPTAQSYSRKLQEAGFTIKVAQLYPRMTPLPQGSGLNGWLQTFAGPFMDALSTDQEKDEVLDEVIEQAKVDMYDEETDQWTLMYVRLRVQACKD